MMRRSSGKKTGQQVSGSAPVNSSAGASDLFRSGNSLTLIPAFLKLFIWASDGYLKLDAWFVLCSVE